MKQRSPRIDSASRKAEALLERRGLSYSHLLGWRFAINVAIGSAIVWYGLTFVANTNPIWGIASMLAASEPELAQAKHMFLSRLINVLVGCAIGLVFLLFAGANTWVLPLALFATVMISSYVVRVKTMWMQAPITAAVVIAASLTQGTAAAGFGQGLNKIVEVVFGCLVGITVSWAMSKVWLIRPPADQNKPITPE